jgi:hypothetical protein
MWDVRLGRRIRRPAGMVCGNCGATIAGKAIVCYRCGTATAIPARPPKPLPPVARPWFMIGILLAMAATLGWFASAEPAGTARQIVLAMVGLVALLWGGHLAWHGRRRT